MDGISKILLGLETSKRIFVLESNNIHLVFAPLIEFLYLLTVETDEAVQHLSVPMSVKSVQNIKTLKDGVLWVKSLLATTPGLFIENNKFAEVPGFIYVQSFYNSTLYLLIESAPETYIISLFEGDIDKELLMKHVIPRALISAVLRTAALIKGSEQEHTLRVIMSTDMSDLLEEGYTAETMREQPKLKLIVNNYNRDE